MRNAVIRKKLLKEQQMIRRFMHYPQRVIVPDSRDIAQWKNDPSHLWAIDPSPVIHALPSPYRSQP